LVKYCVMQYDDDPKATYRWEQGVSKTWDSVQEDEAGNLITVSDDRERSHRAKQNRITKSIRRGLIRYMVVAIDSSKFSAENDYKPCRLEASKACVQQFVTEYYDQNPISQLSVVVTRDRSAERLTELSGNPKNHIHAIKATRNMVGLASLQNTILLAMSMLRHIPNYGHREVLIVFSSLSTCDPGDIFTTLRDAKAQKVRISVICLVAEVFICRQVAELTGGSFAVALDAMHLSELLQQHTIPPPEVQQQESLVTDFIYMGFPKRTFDTHSAYGFEGKRMKLSAHAYICPRCSTRTTDIPTQCCVCHLQLNSSSHIARSHHHLFPVPNYAEYEVKESEQGSGEDAERSTGAGLVSNSDRLTLTVKRGSGGAGRPRLKGYTAVPVPTPAAYNRAPEDGSSGMSVEGAEESVALCVEGGNVRCRGCLESLCKDGKLVLRCPECRQFFCVECDLFVHDSLHNCPGCS
jgi:transcription initiation factor TFIIH subunit 2